MGTIYITVTANSGESYAATVERLSDGYYREDDSENFDTGLVFADKDITLTEESAPNKGSYTVDLTGDTWSDGLYRLRIHDTGNNNKVEGVKLFGVLGGEEVEAGDVPSVYHANVNFTKDNSGSKDEYTITWFKNGRRITSGVTNAAISVIKRADASYLIDNETLTQIGSTASYKYDATGGERQTAGEACVVITSGTIDSAVRQFSWNLGRDSSS